MTHFIWVAQERLETTQTAGQNSVDQHIALGDPKFELRMWRGPTWNCMTYWAARGCIRYGRPDAARRLLGAALDATALQFQRTGTIWEFYHPLLGDPRSLKRKSRGRPIPCQDYLGHNPLLTMVALRRESTRVSSAESNHQE